VRRSASLTRKAPLRRTRRRLTTARREQATRFHRSIHGKRCVSCGAPATEAHHAIEAQYLRRHYPLHVYDTRNAVPVCGRCHANHTAATRRLPRACLPVEAETFAAALGLTHLLERYYRPSAYREAA